MNVIRDFKISRINGQAHLYPFPVIKKSKYLIAIDERYIDFFIDSWSKNYLTHPDLDPNYLENTALHSDNQTKIKSIQYENLNFNFLNSRSDKAKGITKVLTRKIISFIREEVDSKEKLLKALENQMNCKTCQSLGISSDSVISWVEKLVEWPSL